MTDHDPSAKPPATSNSSAPSESASIESTDNSQASRVDQGPGCLPAVLAAAALSGIGFFVCCGVSTWFLFQQRTALAVQTLRQSYIPEIEQSLLAPESKVELLKEIRSLADQMERAEVENWQSAAVMQRLQRLPVLQWGDLQATEAFIIANGNDGQQTKAKQQFHRVRLAVKRGSLTSFDFASLLESVQIADPTVASGKRLTELLTLPAAMEVVTVAQLLADREQVETVESSDVVPIQIAPIVQAEIQNALREPS